MKYAAGGHLPGPIMAFNATSTAEPILALNALDEGITALFDTIRQPAPPKRRTRSADRTRSKRWRAGSRRHRRLVREGRVA